MDRVNSFISLRGRKVLRNKCEPLMPNYCTVLSTASSALCSNNLTTSTTNPLWTNIPTSENNMTNTTTLNYTFTRTQTTISEPIYTLSSSSSTPHSSGSNIGIETWARNLTTPILYPSSQTFNFSAPPNVTQSASVNLKLSSLWEDASIYGWLLSTINLFYPTFSRNSCAFQRCWARLITRSYAKYSIVFGTPGTSLIKLFKISDDNRFDRLLHQTGLGDRQPIELLSELRTLLGESCNVGTDLGKLLRKLFLNRLPPQVRLILAGSPQPTLDLMAQRADDIMAKMATTLSLNSNPTQLLQNQIFEQRLDQLTDAIVVSITGFVCSSRARRLANKGHPRITLTCQRTNFRFA